MEQTRHWLAAGIVFGSTLICAVAFAQPDTKDERQQRAEQRQHAMDDTVTTADAVTAGVAEAEASQAAFTDAPATHLRLLAGAGFTMAPVFKHGTGAASDAPVERGFGGGLTLDGGVAFWPWQADWAGVELWLGAQIGYAGTDTSAMATLGGRAGAQAYLGGSNLAAIAAVGTGFRLLGAHTDPADGPRREGTGHALLNRLGAGVRLSNDARDSVGELVIFQEHTGLSDRPAPLVFRATFEQLNTVAIAAEFAYGYPTAGEPTPEAAPDETNSVYAMLTISRSFDWVW